MALQGHARHETFDSATEFDDYTNIFDEHTRQLLQREPPASNPSSYPDSQTTYTKASLTPPRTTYNTSTSSKVSGKPPLANNESTFKQWHKSRRRTLDELESRGVLHRNFFNLSSSATSISTPKSTTVPTIPNNTSHASHMTTDTSSIISVEDEKDELEDLELHHDDLYFIHCHQTVSHSQNSPIQAQLSISSSSPRLPNNTLQTNAPPPTAVHTPINAVPQNNTSNGFNLMQHQLRTKLERHSQQMQRQELEQALLTTSNTSNESAISPSPPPYPSQPNNPSNPRKSQHFSGQKSIQHLLTKGGSSMDQQLFDDRKDSHPSSAFNPADPGPHSSANAQIMYANIPEQLDGGLLSNNVFLAYKHCIETSMVRHTEQAGAYLDQMKKESNLLEQLHRDTVFAHSDRLLYGEEDAGNAPDVAKEVKEVGVRKSRLKKLSQIDENLADVRDKMGRMARVQRHVMFIQKQFDTHMNSLRKDQTSLLETAVELKERQVELEAILSELEGYEVWLITNIASIIAERSENIDSLNRRISDATRPPLVADSQRYQASVTSQKEFIEDINVLIRKLSAISDQKRAEIDRLRASVKGILRQNRGLMNSATTAECTVTARLMELQTHYKLPRVVQDMDGSGRSKNKVSASVDAMERVVESVDMSKYLNRALELWHSAVLYSEQSSKVFYAEFVMMVNTLFVDCVCLEEFVKSNISTGKDAFGEVDREVEHVSSGTAYDVFTPISLSGSDVTRFDMKGVADGLSLEDVNGGREEKSGDQWLEDIMKQEEFESVKFVKSLSGGNEGLYRDVRRIAKFAKGVVFREHVVSCVAEYVAMECRTEVLKIGFWEKGKIQRIVEEKVKVWMQWLLTEGKWVVSRGKEDGLDKNKVGVSLGKEVRRVVRLNGKKNTKCVYKIAAIVLYNVYHIDMPFAM